MYRKKLIEVALPLDAINRECVDEKLIHSGHPKILHIWWARRPLAACRAVLFASLVDDPSSRTDKFPTKEAQNIERHRLFRILEDLIKWDNADNEYVLSKAFHEIMQSTNNNPPPILDPFCGSGSIPLEAQRLGLKAYASDLNPVAVLITKSLVEIPSKFSKLPPINPESRKNSQKNLQGNWSGSSGLVEDVVYYGEWVRKKAENRIGHMYRENLTQIEDKIEGIVINDWLWVRTIKCPNPACGAWMPLVRSFSLSKKEKKPVWIEPIIDRTQNPVQMRFEVRIGNGDPPKGTKQRGRSRCLFCGMDNIDDSLLREQAKRYGICRQLMAIAADGPQGRMYISPSNIRGKEIEALETEWLGQNLPDNPRWFSPPSYGLSTYQDLFTPRQIVALSTFSDLISEVKNQIYSDAKIAGMPDTKIALNDGGTGALAYAEAVIIYLALVLNKMTDINNAFSTWKIDSECADHLFTRQAIPMVWDFVEANPLSNSRGSWKNTLRSIVKSMNGACLPAKGSDHKIKHLDAASQLISIDLPLISTDPPYYDNIGYADLSDFFYVWLRHSIGDVYPDLFSTLLSPKAEELVADPYRFDGDKEKAKQFFEKGLAKFFSNIYRVQNLDYPITIYYAHKQKEKILDIESSDSDSQYETASTGWETMLEGLLNAKFSITGIWPLKTEMKGRQISIKTNALASSIVFVCRPRSADAVLTTRREFITILKKELPEALRNLQDSDIAPVDLAQAAIGPGMAIFSRYSKILEADGSPMRVRTALQLINQYLDEYLSKQEGEYDPDTRWALSWFEQFGMNEGPFGDAETLSKAKNTSVKGMVEAGILKAGSGKARLLRRDEIDPNWDPATDCRLTVWEATQHLIRTLDKEGESRACELQQKLGGLAQNARDLAYRLYSICERQGWSQEALAYNSLVTAWPRLQDLAVEKMRKGGQQTFEV